MGRKGRKPLPLAVRQVTNKGWRPLNLNEPTHGVLDPTCPEELIDPVARAEWDRLAVALSSRGHCTQADRASLMGYCVKYGQWMALEAEVRKKPFVIKAPSGYPRPNPALSMANTAFNLVLKAAAELGLTPSSRTRVVATKGADAGDDFTQFQRGRQKTA
jgi:P27 family predicted phage terminase small subunit